MACAVCTSFLAVQIVVVVVVVATCSVAIETSLSMASGKVLEKA